MDLAAFESLVLEIQQTLGDETIEHFLFRPRPAGIAPRQVAWIPTKFKSSPPDRANGASVVDVLFTESLIVEVQHYGSDLADCCQIRTQVANAIRRVMHTSSTPFEGYYNVDPLGDDEAPPVYEWNSASVLVQRYVWALNIPRIDDVYPAEVKRIEIVDSTQITPAVDGVLTPGEQLDIE